MTDELDEDRPITIDELSAGYGRELIRARLAAERAQAARDARVHPGGPHGPGQAATPRPHGKSGRHRTGGSRGVIR